MPNYVAYVIMVHTYQTPNVEMIGRLIVGWMGRTSFYAWPKINTAITAFFIAHTEKAKSDISTTTSQKESKKHPGHLQLSITHKAAVNSRDIKKDVGT